MSQITISMLQKRIAERKRSIAESQAGREQIKAEYDALVQMEQEDAEELERLEARLAEFGEVAREPMVPTAHPLDGGTVRKVQAPQGTPKPVPVVDREPPPRPMPRQPMSLSAQEIAAAQLQQEPNFDSDIHRARGSIMTDTQFINDAGELEEGI